MDQPKQALALIGVSGVLTALLLTGYRQAIPQHEIWASRLGFVGVLMASALHSRRRDNQTEEVQWKLKKTRLFNLLFLCLSGTEVVCTIVIPWLLLLTRRDAGSSEPLVPHLFIFQCQILLEGILFLTAPTTHCPMLVLHYTVIANLYRSVTLWTWLVRASKSSARFHFLMPYIAFAIWIASNLFVYFVWYPLIQRTTTKKSN